MGREALLGDLKRWCEGEGRVGARLVHAAGGMGKTRLAVELCRRMRDEGWRVGFLPKGVGMDRFAMLVESDEPVMAVIDYAEGRGQLRELLAVAAARNGEKGKKKLRLLLLARNAEEWWAYLRGSDGTVKELLSDEPVALKAVEAEPEAVFREAAKAFAKERNKKAPEGAVPGLADPRFERVLYVHMAALVAVEGGKIEADTLIEDVLDHEQRFWREQIERVDVDDMRHVVAAITLTGGAASKTEARKIVELISGEPNKKMALLLRDIYPGTAPQYVVGLEPDLLGEAMVWRVLSKEGASAGAYLDRVFEGATEQALRNGFAVLGRLSEYKKEAEGWIGHVLGRDVAGRAMAALAAAKAVGERTAYAALGRVLANVLAEKGTVEIAKRLEPELPYADRTVSLREVGHWVLKVQLANISAGADEERAEILGALSAWQSALGQWGAALASIQEAVAIYRRLAQARPELFVPKLAASLNNLCADQHTLGQRQVALTTIQEAVTLYRQLARAVPEFLPDLARSLSNLGSMHDALGQREASLASSLEAVALYRQLAEARPDLFLPELATSLSNLSLDQKALGRRDAALVSILEAVALRRRLAQARPDAFLPTLAGTLLNLSAAQSALGQSEPALASATESVTLYRRLAEVRPEAFRPDLATSISNLGAVQSNLGRYEAALVSTQEAVALRRTLAESHPEAFLPNLAASLNNLGAMQSILGQTEAALASTQEAVTLRRTLAQVQPEAFLPELATSLNNLSVLQNALGQREVALTSIREAVALCRRLAEEHPEAFMPTLAKSLNNLALVLHALGRTAETLPIAAEALDTLWPFYEHLPAAHGELAGYILRTMADVLKALGHAPDKRFTERMTRYMALSGS